MAGTRLRVPEDIHEISRQINRGTQSDVRGKKGIIEYDDSFLVVAQKSKSLALPESEMLARGKRSTLQDSQLKVSTRAPNLSRYCF